MMPVTLDQYERSLRAPALCEQLRIRDLLDDVAIQIDGSFVAGYELSGLTSLYARDEDRNRNKQALEALVRSLPERSMRMQMRFEIAEGTGELLARYNREQHNPSAVLQAIDREHVLAWRERDGKGQYLRHLLHAYFIWNPRVHHQSPDFEWKRRMKSNQKGTWSLAAAKCIERTRWEHEDLLAEFNSLMAGVEATLNATGMSARRMTHQELFLEIKRALNPLLQDILRYRPFEHQLVYASARAQAANVNIEDEADDYLKIGGLLYSFISLKDLPDATFPGMLRELLAMPFPLVANVEVTLPDQSKVQKQFKSRLRKMMAAQRDIHGGFRLNVDAQVAEEQLIEVLKKVISSSLKVCEASLIVGVRTSKPVHSRADREEAERMLADRRQRVLHALARMNGARGIPEMLAQKRLYFGSLPAMASDNKREITQLTLHTADLLPVEVPWGGTPHSPVMLFETPERQLIPFSPFDASLGDANLLMMAKSGGGKTFMAQMFLLMLARTNPLISILERGDSYRPLVELMGGRTIAVDLEGRETLNPWDLPPGETQPTKDKIAFLKNLTLHMIGRDRRSDDTLLDNLLSDAIARTYKRCASRFSNPIPTFNDLKEELANWRDEERIERTMDEAKLASIKLRSWTGDKGVYANLFDRRTTMRLDTRWLFFDVEGLSADPLLETAMSMVIAHAVSERASGKTGQPSITVLDECWALLDSPSLAPEVVQLFRTARKRHGSVWGISQTPEDFVGTETRPREHGPGILKNATTKIVGQQPGDTSVLVRHLSLNPAAVREVKEFSAPEKGQSARALLVLGEKAETTQTICLVPTALDYWICTTFPRERRYRTRFLNEHKGRPLLACYEELAKRFPRGLAELPLLPEESIAKTAETVPAG
jgi:type IV secretory pathway VirB4 component